MHGCHHGNHLMYCSPYHLLHVLSLWQLFDVYGAYRPHCQNCMFSCMKQCESMKQMILNTCRISKPDQSHSHLSQHNVLEQHTIPNNVPLYRTYELDYQGCFSLYLSTELHASRMQMQRLPVESTLCHNDILEAAHHISLT